MTIKSTLKSNDYFYIEEDKNHHLIQLKDAKDSFKMNWVENLSNHYWGEVKTKLPLEVNITREYHHENEIIETYEFKNNQEYDLVFNGTDVGIYLTFPDYYGEAKKCMTHCCHTHLWCGENVSYAMALKMGGKGKNLGLLLTKGAIKDYSIERNFNLGSNDRGSFILHPENVHLKPGETYTIQWKLFWHEGKEDFYQQLKENKVMTIHAPHYVLYEGEEICFDFSLPQNSESLKIVLEEDEIPFKVENNRVYVCYQAKKVQAYHFQILWNQQKTHVSFLYQPKLEKLVEKRVKFIADNQQITTPGSSLYGAYVIYDNEEKTKYYDFKNTDHNAARERLGMGTLMACYLQKHPDKTLQKSLDLYEEYVYRELYDEKSGEVFNGVLRNNQVRRLYNYPFVALFLLELYQLKRKDRYLIDVYHCLKKYYQEGGVEFYAFEIPMVKTYHLLLSENHQDLAADLLSDFEKHGEQIMKFGTNYPPHEVNYEQSIVAPGAIIMIQLYLLTKKNDYLKEAGKQIALLDLFHGRQPDYHLYQTGIRHWDGYWFGKRALYGDTFPHYWSALSALAFYPAKKIPAIEEYGKNAEDVFRGILSLFSEDGQASCAMVYPKTVNGTKAHYYDEWANDQDFGLYFTFRNTIEKEEKGSYF